MEIAGERNIERYINIEGEVDIEGNIEGEIEGEMEAREQIVIQIYKYINCIQRKRCVWDINTIISHYIIQGI